MHLVKVLIRLCESVGRSDLRWAHMSEGTFSDIAAHLYVRGGSRRISDGVRFNQITILTLRIRTDRLEQTV